MKPPTLPFVTLLTALGALSWSAQAAEIGQESALPRHLADGEEFEIGWRALLQHGKQLFTARWTLQEGAGRPLTKGVGTPLADPESPLVFPRNFNRLSAPDANSCAGCHNAPHGIPGGGGDFVTNVFVLGQRFDFITFDRDDPIPTRGSLDEGGLHPTMGAIANSRSTLGMFGSGYIEMLARQMTADLQAIRDTLTPGDAAPLTSKGVQFGELRRTADGAWDTAGVEGLPETSLGTQGPEDPPNLILRPFHQAGRVVSIREFSNNAFNHHHGLQSAERFGEGEDPDGDGFVNEVTRADMTAVSVYQATLAVPGRVIPRNREIEQAVLLGETKFSEIGCAECHLPSLPLDNQGWIYTEPNPYNPPGNLQLGDAPTYSIDLSFGHLPGVRLEPDAEGVVHVPAYTDLKLHDLTDGPDDPNREVLDMQFPPGTPEFFAGNGKFLTKKLWGAANEPPYFHHGKFTTMREAIWAHGGEGAASRDGFASLTEHERNCVIEFLKTLQVLPPHVNSPVVDENGRARSWPPQARERDHGTPFRRRGRR